MPGSYFTTKTKEKLYCTQKKIKFALCIIFHDNLTTFRYTNLIIVKKKIYCNVKNNIYTYIYINICVCVCCTDFMLIEIKILHYRNENEIKN